MFSKTVLRSAVDLSGLRERGRAEARDRRSNGDGPNRIMELVSGLLSRAWVLTGLSDLTNDKRTKKMEEKALEVYGE